MVHNFVIMASKCSHLRNPWNDFQAVLHHHSAGHTCSNYSNLSANDNKPQWLFVRYSVYSFTVSLHNSYSRRTYQPLSLCKVLSVACENVCNFYAAYTESSVGESPYLYSAQPIAKAVTPASQMPCLLPH